MAVSGLRLAIAASSLALAVQQQSAAQGFCTTPYPPNCIDGFGAFESDWALRDCRSEIDRFAEEVQSYARCRTDEIEGLYAELEVQVRRFNCRARGESVCY